MYQAQARARNYLIPVETRMDSERDVRVSAVRVDDALDGMSVAGNRLNFIILDARRNKPFECRTRGEAVGWHLCAQL